MHHVSNPELGYPWFYPYHYAPFASDLKGLSKLKINFDIGLPFKPFNQLMGVLPAASSHALPLHYRKLMTDPNSPIIDFYPTDFEVDMKGKRFTWQNLKGIAKLPVIDEGRLLAETEKVEHKLTEEERNRNTLMHDMLFVNVCHAISPYILSLDDQYGQLSEKERIGVKGKINPTASGGMNGYISPCNDPCPPVFKSPVVGMEDIVKNQVIRSVYILPNQHKHIGRPPSGVVFPEKTVTRGDLKPAQVLRHDDNCHANRQVHSVHLKNPHNQRRRKYSSSNTPAALIASPYVQQRHGRPMVYVGAPHNACLGTGRAYGKSSRMVDASLNLMRMLKKCSMV